MKSAGLVISLFFLLCTHMAGAQQPYVAWVKHYGTADGLAHREVNAIFQDRQGFMWFGTKYGLSRFDGKTFTTFTKDRNGLAFDDIQSIAQDADGMLWLMGPFGESRIALFNPLTGKTTLFEEKFGRKLLSSQLNVPQRLTGSADGTIFFACHEPAILSSYHPKSGLKQVRLSQFSELTIRQTTRRNTVWAVADKVNLVELTAEGRVLREYKHSLNLIANSLSQRNAGTEFCYMLASPTRDFAYHFYRIDDSGNRHKLPKAQLPLISQALFPVCHVFDKTGAIWDGTRLRDSTGTVLLDISDQLSGEAVVNRSFWVDQNGSMWLGTSFGVYQVKVVPNYFRRLFYNATYTGEKAAAIRGIMVTGDAVYAGFEKFGLYSSNLKGGSVRMVLGRQRHGLAVALTEHPPGRLILGLGNRLIDFELAKGIRTAFKFPDENTTIWTVKPFGGDRWLIGGRLGLWLGNAKTGEVELFTKYNRFPELGQSHVLHIAPDRSGTFWICSGTGLYTADPVKGVTGRYWSGDKGGFYLPADVYEHFYQDKNGIYWLGTANSGMIRWDRQRNKFRQFRRSDGLSNDNIHAIYPDRRGRLWLSSDHGIMQFDPVKLTTRTYFTHDGLTHNEFNRVAHFQDKAGNIYFGGLNGITAFDPRDFESEKPANPLNMRVVSFRQFDHELGDLKDKTEELVQTRKIVIRPGEHTAVLDFAMLNFTDSEKNVYAYQLRGLDNAWTQQTESTLRLGTLPYGNYQLLIKGQAADGRWSGNVLVFNVVVVKPFYLQTWFLVLAALVLMAGIWGWLKWRIWNHRQEQMRLEAEIRHATARIEQDKKVIERQARSLHELNEAKSRFFANISHEFRTPLTVILGMASELKRYTHDELLRRSPRAADLIERNGSSLLRLINQILDLSKLEAGSMALQPVRADLVRFVRYVAESFDTMATGKDVQMHFDSGEEFLEADFDKDKLQDILSNLLTNAIKFTPAGGKVYLGVAAGEYEALPEGQGYYHAVSPVPQPGSEWISVRVRNTGAGIGADKLPLIFDRFFQASVRPASETGGTGIGLALVRELVLLMQGGLAVRSAPGEGAEFVVRFRRTRRAPFLAVPQPPVGVGGDKDVPEINGVAAEKAEEKPVLLLAEDNEDVAAYIVSALHTHYRIVHAENGQAGIDLALESIPDLILTDVMMPLKDGYELCDILKNNAATSHIPIVMLTARAGTNDRISGLRRGADAYLTKPFQREELEVVLSNLLESRRHLRAYYSRQAVEFTEFPETLVEENESLENLFLQKLRSALEAQWGNASSSTEVICQEMGMSRSSLHRKMIALTGMSVTRYDRSLRLARARQMLAATPMPVSEVAYAVGFDDPKYFSRLFSEEFEHSPTEFRRLKQ